MQKYGMLGNCLAVICVLLLLSGCAAGSKTEQPAGDGAGQAGKTAETAAAERLEQMYADNQVAAVLAQKECLRFEEKDYEADQDEPVSWKRGQYQMGEQGLQMDLEYHDVGGEISYEQMRVTEDHSGASYMVTSAGEKSLFICPAAIYETSATALWQDRASGQETVESCTEQDGRVVLATRTDNESDTNFYRKTVYQIDGATGLLLAREITSYNKQDEPVAVSKLEVSYDTPFVMEREPFAEIAQGADGCQVSAVYDYNTENAETQQFSVQHDTLITMCNYVSADGSGKSYGLYTDAELTEPFQQAVAATGEELHIYAVEEQGKELSLQEKIMQRIPR